MNVPSYTCPQPQDGLRAIGTARRAPATSAAAGAARAPAKNPPPPSHHHGPPGLHQPHGAVGAPRPPVVPAGDPARHALTTIGSVAHRLSGGPSAP
ncbi:hypothetical protein ATKI12_0332 [Kitasatospora sp. Ki12]